jgi:hypothetical protein
MCKASTITNFEGNSNGMEGHHVLKNNYLFDVVDARRRQIALKPRVLGYDRYCADEDNRVICNRNGLGQWERFTVHTNQRRRGYIALQGGKSNRYCANDGANGASTIKCNRNGIGQWERFSVYNVGENNNHKCGDDKWGRYVHVTIPRTSILTLCEVQIKIRSPPPTPKPTPKPTATPTFKHNVPIMLKCNAQELNQQWYHDAATGHIKTVPGKCLSKTGNSVDMKACSAADKNQRWVYNAFTRQVQEVQGGKCLQASNRGLKGGNMLVEPCDDEDQNQRWNEFPSSLKGAETVTETQLLDESTSYVGEGPSYVAPSQS